MKQHITKKQWEELSNLKQEELIDFFEGDKIELRVLNSFKACWVKLKIGEMIEFLGDDLEQTDNQKDKWMIWCGDEEDNAISETELCDVLWRAVKNKLNNNKC